MPCKCPGHFYLFLCLYARQIFSYQQLFNFTKTVFQKIGCSDEHAEIATKALLSADLRGIDSHGIARLSGYVRLWKQNGLMQSQHKNHS